MGDWKEIGHGKSHQTSHTLGISFNGVVLSLFLLFVDIAVAVVIVVVIVVVVVVVVVPLCCHH